MYELIIFTMMLPNVEPLWVHLEPTSEEQCLARVENLGVAFAEAKNLVYSFKCERVEKKEEEDDS